MTHIPYVHTDSDRSERTSTPPLRPKTAEARGSHERPTQTRSVADSDCIRLDLCRWETEGGALIGPDSAGSCCTGNDILQTDSQTVQLANLGSPSNRLAGRPARRVPAKWPDENRVDIETRWSSAKERPPSMRLGHVHLKVRDLNRSVRFYTSVLDLGLTEHTVRYAFLGIGTEHLRELREDGEGTEPPHEVSYADGLDLLEVERSGFEERFGDVQLPAVAFDRSSMRQDRDHRQLIIGRIIGQQQTRAHFARNAHVDLPDVTALRSGHRPVPLPPSCPA